MRETPPLRFCGPGKRLDTLPSHERILYENDDGQPKKELHVRKKLRLRKRRTEGNAVYRSGQNSLTSKVDEIMKRPEYNFYDRNTMSLVGEELTSIQ